MAEIIRTNDEVYKKVSPTLLSFDLDDVEEISEKEFQKNKKEIDLP